MFRLFIIVSCLFVVTACSTDAEQRRAEYLDANYLMRLELPPDLIFEDSNSQLILPKPSERAMQEYKAGLEEDAEDKE